MTSLNPMNLAMLAEPINAGTAKIFQFGGFAPTWGMLLGFALVLTISDLARVRASNPVARKSGLHLLKSLPLSFALCLGATAICLLLSACAVLAMMAIVGVIMKLFSELQPMPVLRIAISWIAFLGGLYLAWLIIAYRQHRSAED